MKLSLVSLIALLALAIVANSCKNEPPIIPEEEFSPKWESVPMLAGMDIRYTIQHKGVLYVGAVDERTRLGAVYKTEDAKIWTKVKDVGFDFGAMTFHGDTLYVIGDSLYRYLPSLGWQGLFSWGFRSAQAVSDMIFYKGKLYVMLARGNLRTLQVEMNGNWTALRPFNGTSEGAMSRFCKVNKGDSEVVYVRPYPTALVGTIYRFDGERFIAEPTVGLTGQDYPTMNAMMARGDSLLLGYYYWYSPDMPAGGLIKSYKDGVFSNFTDSLPLLSLNPQLVQPYSTYPNSFAFYGDRLFVGTFPIGVVEWIPQTRSWKNISKGLPTVSPDTTYKDFYASISFIEAFKGHIIVGYGHPAFFYWATTRGMYIYRVSDSN